MVCLDCGNCHKNEPVYYCTGKNEFIVTETAIVRERAGGRWREGNPNYEQHRRQLRKDKLPQVTS